MLVIVPAILDSLAIYDFNCIVLLPLLVVGVLFLLYFIDFGLLHDFVSVKNLRADVLLHAN